MNNSAVADLENKKNAKRMVEYVYGLIDGSHYVMQLESIRDLCKELELKLN